MLENIQNNTIKQIQSINPSPQTIIALLQHDEPHIVGKLLNHDIVEFYKLCHQLKVDACKLGQYLYQLHCQHLNSSLFSS